MYWKKKIHRLNYVFEKKKNLQTKLCIRKKNPQTKLCIRKKQSVD